MPNRERIMAGVLDQMELAIWQTVRDLLRQPRCEGAILCPVPERNWHADLLERKSPGRRVNFGIGHHAIRRGSPGLPRAFEANLEGARFAQDIRVARLKKF